MRIIWPGVAALAALGTIVLAGCGGGGTSPAPGGSSVVTRSNEPSFSQDAIILALRAADSPFLSANAAAAFDADLKTIREKVPAIVDIRARVNSRPKELMVQVDSSTPWLATWKSGDLSTGDSAVDAVLKKYDAQSVALLADYSSTSGGAAFIITFGQTLSIPLMKDEVKETSAHFVASEENQTIGDGDNIIAEPSDTKKYTFSRGWGDCPAGCINRHSWEVTLAADGNVTVTESGTPL